MVAVEVFLICWFITHFEPISERLPSFYGKKIDFAIDVITCFKCLSFWAVLIFTFNVYYAIFASLLAHLYDSITERD